MVRKWYFWIAALMLTAPAALAQNAAMAPDVLVKSTADEVLGVIKNTKDRKALIEVVEKKVLPTFDFQAMTRMAVGRHWRDASPAQQQSLENAFRTLLVTTYTQALMQSNSAQQSVEVRPLMLRPADDDVTVRTTVRDSGAKPIAVDYRLSKVGSAWKVYDVVVENLSLVTNYRSTFGSEIGKGGIDGLIKSLEAKNRQNIAG
ncbi:MAG: ABC transporter substrate-binding protein [Betaproteobacteria bacterium]|nr:ABC transporter substrate-binding protein [Betaproteobacteria bacterium]